MKTIVRLSLVISLLSLLACRTEVVADNGSEYLPSLRYFDLLDSYDQDTAKPPYGDLAVNPYLYDGQFNASWVVNSLEDYSVHLWINDRPSLNQALLVQSEICGEHHWCDQKGTLVCQYTSDLYLNCDANLAPLDIAPLFAQVPQQLYLLLEVCDRNSSYCEYDYLPVSFE